MSAIETIGLEQVCADAQTLRNAIQQQEQQQQQIEVNLMALRRQLAYVELAVVHLEKEGGD